MIKVTLRDLLFLDLKQTIRIVDVIFTILQGLALIYHFHKYNTDFTSIYWPGQSRAEIVKTVVIFSNNAARTYDFSEKKFFRNIFFFIFFFSLQL